MIKVEFDKENNFLKADYLGDIFLNDIVEYISATKNNTSYPRTLKIFSDATKANMLLNAIDLPTLVKENNQSLKKYDYISMLKSFREALIFIKENSLTEDFKYRLEKVAEQAWKQDWLNKTAFENIISDSQ